MAARAEVSARALPRLHSGPMSRLNATGPRRLLWSRWLVLAVLALTLPLQGALAATMGIGMALMSEHGGGAVATMPTDCHEMAGMDMGAMHMGAMSHDGTGMGGMTHGGHDGASTDPSPTDAAAPHDDGGDAATDHHCGICLQCCIGAAMPIAPLMLAAQDLRDATPTLRAIDAPEQTPQPLERPPKTFLA